MLHFQLLRRAREDLLEIAHFTADRWGQKQAEAYIVALFSGFQRLLDSPGLRRAFPSIPPYFRSLVGRHAIFYRVEEERIIIVRVLHAAMLPERHLSSEGDDE